MTLLSHSPLDTCNTQPHFFGRWIADVDVDLPLWGRYFFNGTMEGIPETSQSSFTHGLPVNAAGV